MNRSRGFSREDLENLLAKLIPQILEKAAIALKQKRIKPDSRPYMHFKVDGSGVHGKELYKPDWAIASIVVVHDVEKLSLYDKIVDSLSEFYGVEREIAKRWLSQFVGRIAEQVLEGQKNIETLNQNIRAFLEEAGDPQHAYEFNVRVYVEGLSLEDREVQLDNDTILRNARIQDFEGEVELDTWKYRFSPFPSAFLDIKAISTSPPGVSGNEIEPVVEIGIATLRLFKVGVVHYTCYEWHTRAILSPTRGSIIPNTSYVENPRYPVHKTDVDRLKRFWSEVRNRLPKEVARYWLAERASALTIAFQRYSDALLQDGIFERRIATGVMGLEALYLGGETTESSFKLRTRAAKVLSHLGYDPTDVFENLKKAYNIRSNFVHGRLVKDQSRADLSKLMSKVLEYLRASVLVTLFESFANKDQVIELTDRALISSEANDDLENRVEKLAQLVKAPQGDE